MKKRGGQDSPPKRQKTLDFCTDFPRKDLSYIREVPQKRSPFHFHFTPFSLCPYLKFAIDFIWSWPLPPRRWPALPVS